MSGDEGTAPSVNLASPSMPSVQILHVGISSVELRLCFLTAAFSSDPLGFTHLFVLLGF